MSYTENTPHPRPLAWFTRIRATTTSFAHSVVREVYNNITHVLITAPVKSGKKDIVELVRLITNEDVIYITSLDRKDVKKQKEELTQYGIQTHVIGKNDTCQIAIADIKSRKGTVFLCFDECDYGSGDKQKMSSVYNEFIDNKSIFKIYFSATSYEIQSSMLTSRSDFKHIQYNPPPEYNGAMHFISSGLVIDGVADFFDVDDTGVIYLTDHGAVVVRESIKEDRHIGVVRVVGKKVPMKDLHKKPICDSIKQQLKSAVPDSYDWDIFYIDSDAAHAHDWECQYVQGGAMSMRGKKNILYVINQTCTRGTDLKGWHQRLAFWHDARSHTKGFLPNTLIQAMLRPCHYGPPQPIRLYVDRLVIELAATNDLDAWIKGGGKPPARTKLEGKSDALNLISETSYETHDKAKVYATSIGMTKSATLTLNTDTMTFQYRGSPRKILSERETRLCPDNWYGTSVKTTQINARIMPVLADLGGKESVRYIVVYAIQNDGTIPIHTTTKSMYEHK